MLFIIRSFILFFLLFICIVTEFISNIKDNFWPYDTFVFKEEALLEFLHINEYNMDRITNKIQKKSIDFIEFFTENYIDKTTSTMHNNSMNKKYGFKLRNK